VEHPATSIFIKLIRQKDNSDLPTIFAHKNQTGIIPIVF
jgi:hypothetical protein